MNKSLSVIAIALTLNSTLSAAAQFSKSSYQLDTRKLCDGYPQLPVETPTGLCVGLMLGQEDGLKMPRYAVESNEGIIYLTEMGGWAYGKGTVYAYYQAQNSKGVLTPILVNLFPKSPLTMPNGIVMDPEGRLYVGTPTGVYRFSPRTQDGKFNLNPRLEPVFEDLAGSLFRSGEYSNASTFNNMKNSDKHKHPLIQIAANKDFTELYVNAGAPSDDCTSGLRTLNSEGLCTQAESTLASAAVWKVTLSNDSERKNIGATAFARGLRNSMALAVHPSGTVLQGENSLDLPDEDRPYEELNVLSENKHYGWPYCHSAGEVAPAFKRKIKASDCLSKYTAPKVFMPAHTAPLGLLYYSHTLMPQFNNKLLVSWHGYRRYGQRVVAYPVDDIGIPTSEKYDSIVSNWAAKSGIRPRGAPTGLTQLRDGSILILDDKNGALLRLSRGNRAQMPTPSAEAETFSEDSLRAFTNLLPVLEKNCAVCHSQFSEGSAEKVLAALEGDMLDRKSPFTSKIWKKVESSQMPPQSAYEMLSFDPNKDGQDLRQKLESFLRSL